MAAASFRALEKSTRLPGLASRLSAAVDRCPDADAAARLVPGVLSAARGDALRRAWDADADRLCGVATALCGGAPFFAPILERHPTWLPALCADSLTAERLAADYAARLSAAMSPVTAAAATAAALRHFKYYELARITVRDLCCDLVPLERTGEILRELSHLADALLQQALACAVRAGNDDAAGPRPAERFAVIGMGKLGSEELNYSSDVDLVYVCEDAASERDGGAIEYYTRVAEEFGRLVRRNTADGFLYRVDLELRPEGKAGPLVVTAATLADYYERWAETWEKAAFMKARPVAGDIDFGWRVIRGIDPIVYRSSMDLAGVEAIRVMKSRIEQAKERGGATFNVKLGAGGIRDIEFVAQALQLVHGGRQPQVRQRSTQSALEALAGTGALGAEASGELVAAYRFLRRVENRIQMEGERQLYRLPAAAADKRRIARSLGFLGEDCVIAFEAALDAHRARVREIFTALFDVSGGERILDLFQRNVPALLINPTTRRLVEDLAGRIASRVESSSSPERAMINLDRFIRGVGRRQFFYELLLDRPELVPRLVHLFAGSEYLSSYVATHPRLIEPLFDDPEVLLRSRAELEASYAEIHAMLDAEGARSEPELSLDALRLFHNREIVNVGLLDMDDRVERADAERSLTDVAELCIERGLEIAEREVARRARKRPAWLRDGEFLVVAMGKLASREITYGSDLDVIFLYDLAEADEEAQLTAQSGFVGLAQKLIWALQTRTPEGVCYEIDARLRPSGNQGLLVSHIDTFTSYHAQTAASWERQALLRARPVAGSQRLADVFARLRVEILSRHNPENLSAELDRIRQRMEAELARESFLHRDFKTGRGGLLDVETIVQYLQLRGAGSDPALLEVRPISQQIEHLAAADLLDRADADGLNAGWEFLQRLSSRLRIIENRSISDLNVERGDLDAVARRLGYGGGGRSSNARRCLLDEYTRRTAEIRAIYERVMRGGAVASPAPATDNGSTEPESPLRRRLRRRTALGAAIRRRV